MAQKTARAGLTSSLDGHPLIKGKKKNLVLHQAGHVSFPFRQARYFPSGGRATSCHPALLVTVAMSHFCRLQSLLYRVEGSKTPEGFLAAPTAPFSRVSPSDRSDPVSSLVSPGACNMAARELICCLASCHNTLFGLQGPSYFEAVLRKPEMDHRKKSEKQRGEEGSMQATACRQVIVANHPGVRHSPSHCSTRRPCCACRLIRRCNSVTGPVTTGERWRDLIPLRTAAGNGRAWHGKSHGTGRDDLLLGSRA